MKNFVEIELDEEMIGDGSDVAGHELMIHADETDRERFADEFGLDGDGLAHHLVGLLGIEFLVFEVVIEEDREIGVQAFVPRDPFVRFAQGMEHESAFFQPEDGTETAAEKQAFDNGKRKKTGTERTFGRDPPERPLGLFLDTGDLLDAAEKTELLLVIRHVGIDHQRVDFAMDVLDHGLEGIETARLGDGHLGTKIRDQILENNPIAPGKKRQDILDKILLVGRKALPVAFVGAEINLFRSPEHLFVFPIGFPYLGILDRIETVSLFIVCQDIFYGNRFHCVHFLYFAPFFKKFFRDFLVSFFTFFFSAPSENKK